MSNYLNQFRQAMMEKGLTPPQIIEPGKMHRFPGFGKAPNNQAGWCLLQPTGLSGAFGDWSTGLSESWRVSREQGRMGMRVMFNTRSYSSMLSKANEIWFDAEPAIPGGHPYLVRKGIKPHGARIYRESLVIRLWSVNGKLQGLQFIAADGNKRFLAGTQKISHVMHVSGHRDECDQIIICEGWATGCTLAEDNPSALVVAACDAGNLQSVAYSVRTSFPGRSIIIAGDDDRLTPGNPGKTKALEAAKAVSARVAFPQWPADAPPELTDFNDLALWLARNSAPEA